MPQLFKVNHTTLKDIDHNSEAVFPLPSPLSLIFDYC